MTYFDKPVEFKLTTQYISCETCKGLKRYLRYAQEIQSQLPIEDTEMKISKHLIEIHGYMI